MSIEILGTYEVLSHKRLHTFHINKAAKTPIIKAWNERCLVENIDVFDWKWSPLTAEQRMCKLIISITQASSNKNETN